MFRWIERGGELELELESESEDGVFIDALEALRELLEESTGAGLGPAVEYSVSAEGAGRGKLLANWLRELAALAAGDGFIPHRIAALTLSDNAVEATSEGSCGVPAKLAGAITDDGPLYEPAPESHRIHARVMLAD